MATAHLTVNLYVPVTRSLAAQEIIRSLGATVEVEYDRATEKVLESGEKVLALALRIEIDDWWPDGVLFSPTSFSRIINRLWDEGVLPMGDGWEFYFHSILSTIEDECECTGCTKKIDADTTQSTQSMRLKSR